MRHMKFPFTSQLWTNLHIFFAFLLTVQNFKKYSFTPYITPIDRFQKYKTKRSYEMD